MTNLYFIENIGCDDTTIGLARMTDDQIAAFKNVVENLNKNSTYGCMPTIRVYKIDESFIRPARSYDPSYKILYMGDREYVLEDNLYDYSLKDGVLYKQGVEIIV